MLSSVRKSNHKCEGVIHTGHIYVHACSLVVIISPTDSFGFLWQPMTLPCRGSRGGYRDIGDSHPEGEAGREYHADKRISVLAVSSAIWLCLLLYVLSKGHVTANLRESILEAPTFPHRSHVVTPSSFWGNVQRPFPTGAWWTNLVVVRQTRHI